MANFTISRTLYAKKKTMELKAPDTEIQKLVQQFNIDNRPPVFDEIQKDRSILEQYYRQIEKWIGAHKGEILLAWWATYGFEPGKAEVVTVNEPNGTRIYVRESASNGG